MQYLSKAYQYYSGINPATLTGAIDVIVVKRKDEHGETVYSCSPFHVRFGKLRVLRAGEKRVTLTLPENLDGPNHEAPFWMKVGDAGEAFFVVETEDEVPEELQTSPVISATEMDHDRALVPSPDFGPSARHGDDDVDEEEDGDRDERFVGAKPRKSGGLGQPNSEIIGTDNGIEDENNTDSIGLDSEPTFLDLNADPSLSEDVKTPRARSVSPSSHGSTGTSHPPAPAPESTSSNMQPVEKVAAEDQSSLSSVSPSSILSTATSLLPSFLTPSSSSTAHEDLEAQNKEKETETQTNQRPPTPPPNPLKKYQSSTTSHRDQALRRGAEKIEDYVHEHKGLTSLGRRSSVGSISSSNNVDAKLPKLAQGEGEEPDVIYTHDAVLDMSGYHQGSERNKQDDAPNEAAAKRFRDEVHLAEDSMSESGQSTVSQNPAVIRFAEDLIISAGSQSKSVSALLRHDTLEDRLDIPMTAEDNDKIAADIASLAKSIENTDLNSSFSPNFASSSSNLRLKQPPSRTREAFVRAGSAPPRSSAEEHRDTHDNVFTLDSPPLPPHDPSTTDYTWEWGQLPIKTPAAIEHKSIEFDLADTTPKSKLKHRDEESHGVSGSNIVSGSESLPRSIQDPQIKHLQLESDRPLTHRAHTDPQAEASGALDRTRIPGKLKNDDEDPYKFILDMSGPIHTFEMGFVDEFDSIQSEDERRGSFTAGRLTFRKFIEDPEVVQKSSLVVKYQDEYLTWFSAGSALAALAIYRRSLQPPKQSTSSALPSLSELGMDSATVSPKVSKGYEWSRWWRRGESAGDLVDVPSPPAPSIPATGPPPPPTMPEAQSSEQGDSASPADGEPEGEVKHYAKTLRLTSDQLKQLNLKEGPNPITFSVTSSYSGLASCAARIFLWDEADAIVISDIDGTITKSDALGHVFAALGRDWTHLGVAKLYTDICNNGYKIMYLTSRAIGQADSTRYYLRGIHQGKYQLPDGPVIMSPDRLFTSLHREVIMRKPELFKMACLRDIQRLFGVGNSEPFYAGFGNRITDAMSYRSVNIPSSRIFTIDSGGEVKMELLELAGYKSSYIHMTDLVDQMFPPVHRSVIPAYTDFNYWRPALPDVTLPDLSPVSPALSATSDSSGRLSMLKNIATLGRRSSGSMSTSSDTSPNIQPKQARPTSPLVGPSYVPEPEEADGYDSISDHEDMWNGKDDHRPSSMPGSFEEGGEYLNDEFFVDRTPNRKQDWLDEQTEEEYYNNGGTDQEFYQNEEEEEDPEMFDDDLLATGEMQKVPYL